MMIGCRNHVLGLFVCVDIQHLVDGLLKSIHESFQLYFYSLTDVMSIGSTDLAISMTMSPSNVVHPSGSVVISCQMDITKLGGSDLVWQIRHGGITHRITNGFTLTGVRVDNNRYAFNRQEAASGHSVTYTLKIIGEYKYSDLT